MSAREYQSREKIDPKVLNRNGKQLIPTQVVKVLQSR